MFLMFCNDLDITPVGKQAVGIWPLTEKLGGKDIINGHDAMLNNTHWSPGISCILVVY